MEAFSQSRVFSVDSSLCQGDRETSQERVNVLVVFMHMSNVAILIRTWMNLQTTMPKEDAGHSRTYCVFSLCPKKNTICVTETGKKAVISRPEETRE